MVLLARKGRTEERPSQCTYRCAHFLVRYPPGHVPAPRPPPLCFEKAALWPQRKREAADLDRYSDLSRRDAFGP
jgi:hypothetical protein